MAKPRLVDTIRIERFCDPDKLRTPRCLSANISPELYRRVADISRQIRLSPNEILLQALLEWLDRQQPMTNAHSSDPETNGNGSTPASP